MSATTALDGLGAVGTAGGRSRARQAAAAQQATAPDRPGPTWVSPVGRAARPRTATPVFVDGGRRARWVRRVGVAIGLALGLWSAAVGLALVGVGSTAGPSLATEGAVLHEPADQAVEPTAADDAGGAAPLFVPDPGPPTATGEVGSGGAGAASGSDGLPTLLVPSGPDGGGGDPAPAGRAADGGLHARTP